MIAKLSIIVALAGVLFAVYQLYFVTSPVGFANTKFSKVIGGTNITFARDENGVMHFWAPDKAGWTKALGYAQAMDRGFQLLFTRIIMQGRLSEIVDGTLEDLFEVDTFMRQRGFARNGASLVSLLEPQVKELLEAYALGINTYFEENGKPMEFKLLGYDPEPWTVADSLTFAKLMIYLGLAQGQEDVEKFIIETIEWNKKNGLQFMKSMFKPHLNSIDDDLIPLLKKVKIEIPFIPEAVKRMPGMPNYSGSNNWAVSSKKSVSGNALYASDPHLDIARLPAVWYEVVGHVASENNYVAGITVPGLPAVAMGRNKHISWGFTYGFMDMIDYYIEDCNDKLECKYGDEYVPLEKINDTIKRKGRDAVDIVLYKTKNHGILELKKASNLKPFPAGLYLSRVFSVDVFGAPIGSIKSINKFHFAKTVEEFQQALHEFDLSCNFIFADNTGSIGYQQTGLLPKRKPGYSGLYPLPGWIKENTWTERYYSSDLKSIINPENGILATANDEHNPQQAEEQESTNKTEEIIAVNAHMGNYRVSRIKQVLSSKEKISIADFQALQSDLYSIQAEKYMEILRPILEKLPNGSPAVNALKTWDLRYNKESYGAVIFEEFYSELLSTVFKPLYSSKDWNFILKRTPVITYFYYFDKILFEYDSSLDSILWKGESRDQLFSRVFKTVLANQKGGPLQPYGANRQIYMSHLMFRDVLPLSVGATLGFNYGPFAFEGSRSTPAQGQIFEVGKGILQTFGVSWRFTTELTSNNRAFDEFDSVLPGGPSEKRIGAYNLYKMDVEKWVNFKYKKVKIEY